MKNNYTFIKLFITISLFTDVVYAATTIDTYKDEFTTVSYSNQNGTRYFLNDWIESGDDNDPSNGRIFIDLTNGLTFKNLDSASISRTLDLSGALSAILSFDVTEVGNTGETLRVEVFNAVTGNWDIATDITGTSSISFALSSDQRSSASAIRFISGSGRWGRRDTYYVENALFAVTYTDTDSDNVANKFDIDDDNDGIIDNKEGVVVKNNPSFEEPTMTSDTWQLVDQANVPNWQTTDSTGKIEFWTDGFQGVPAYSGTQFVEINANEVASLYQVFSTVPGEIIKWSVAHRGRTGTDTAQISIGPDGGTLSVINTMTTDNTAWVVYSGSQNLNLKCNFPKEGDREL